MINNQDAHIIDRLEKNAYKMGEVNGWVKGGIVGFFTAVTSMLVATALCKSDNTQYETKQKQLILSPQNISTKIDLSPNP